MARDHTETVRHGSRRSATARSRPARAASLGRRTAPADRRSPMADPFRVGSVPGVSPGKWFRRWEQRLPDLPLEPRGVEVADQRELLVSRELDMCFVRLPVDRSSLHLVPLYAEPPVVVASKDHPVAAFDELAVADLAGEHLLQDLGSCPAWAAVADEVRDGNRVEPPQMTVAEAAEPAAADSAAAHPLQDLGSCPEWAAVADEVRDGNRVEPPPMTVAEAVEVAASGAGILIVPMSLARLHHRRDVRYRPVTG